MCSVEKYIENEIQSLNNNVSCTDQKNQFKTFLEDLMFEYRNRQIYLDFIIDTFTDNNVNIESMLPQSESDIDRDIEKLFDINFYDRRKHIRDGNRIKDHLGGCYRKIKKDVKKHIFTKDDSGAIVSIDRKLSVTSLIRNHCSEAEQLDIIYSIFASRGESLRKILLLFSNNSKLYYLFALYLLENLSDTKELVKRITLAIKNVNPNVTIIPSTDTEASSE